MQFVSWNIRHGGGKMAGQILQQLSDWNPDVVGLQEFRGTQPSRTIAEGLRSIGLIHQLQTVEASDGSLNGLLLASRNPFVRRPADGQLHEARRWLHVSLESPHNLDVIVMHVPNRGEGDKYGIHDEVVASLATLRNVPAIAFGDTNTGVPGEDEEAAFFNQREALWFTNIRNAGWQDVWRSRNPSAREFTWHHHSGNGFRLDQLFASSSGAVRVLAVQYDWGQKTNGKTISDHAAMRFQLGE
ncbi:MAG: endonuclease/exonuclease/phosphatase family protein [Planctomycetaceae bacterium]